MEQSNEQIAVRVSVETIIWNVVLAILKLVAGLFSNSVAMLSDAVHTLSDVLSTIVVIIGAKLAARKSDSDHPYGHERFECVAAIVLAIMLAVTGIGIGYGAGKNIIEGNFAAMEMPGRLALIAAIVSIIIKEYMYRYTYKAGKKINSGALMADAWHHRSDALSSIGGLVGIIGARLGILVLDSIAGIIICIFILKVAADVFMDAIKKMTDTACDEETVQEIYDTISSVAGVREIRELKTRRFGERIYVDVNIAADADLPLEQSHSISQIVREQTERDFPAVKHCMVHVGPYYESEA